MKVRDFIYKLDLNSYIGINSKDHEEVFAFGNMRSEKMKPYYDREVLNISANSTKLLDENDEEISVPYIELLIKHKDILTVNEAVDNVINKNYGDLSKLTNEMKSDVKLKTLLDIKEFNLSIDKLLNLRCECIDMMRINWSSENFGRLTAYSEVLLELEAISFH